MLQRNFWFCTIDDPSTIDTRHRIGIENIMVETDYPHGDSTWPGHQDVIADAWATFPPDELPQDLLRERRRAFTATRCPRWSQLP